MENENNKILNYLKKHPTNAIIMICSNGILNRTQIENLLDWAKDKPEKYEILKSLIKNNNFLKKEIDDLKEKFYSIQELNALKFKQKIEDKNFFKGKEFIDSLSYIFEGYSFSAEEKEIEYLIFKTIAKNNLSEWDVDYLLSKLSDKHWNSLAKESYNVFKWSKSLIDKYHQNFSVYTWYEISKRDDLEWDIEFLEKYKDNLKWDEIASNTSIPFDEKLIFHFEYKWEENNRKRWGYLVENPSVNWSFDLIKHIFELRNPDVYNINNIFQNTSIIWSYKFLDFKIFFLGKTYSLASFLKIKIPWTSSILNTYKNHLNWSEVSKRKDINWNENTHLFCDYIDWKEFSKHRDWGLNGIEHFEKCIDFKSLSSNTNVDWCIGILYRYKDKLDWSTLARNPSIFWNEEMIDIFQEKDIFWGLTESKTFIWSKNILTKYKERWNSDCSYFIGKKCNDCLRDEDFFTPEICKNPNVIFTIDFILGKLDEWEKVWTEFTDKIWTLKAKKNLKVLNGKKYDTNNEIWKDISNNKNLYNELLIYFKEFWDYNILMKNKNILWNIELFIAFEEKLDSSNWRYTIVNFWSEKNHINLFKPYLSSELTNELLDLFFSKVE